MRPIAYTIEREHAYSGGWTKSHAHFATTAHRMPAYSIEATPYRWVMRDEVRNVANTWGIGYDASFEDHADKFIQTKTPTAWVQDHRNQLALLISVLLRPGSGQVTGSPLCKGCSTLGRPSCRHPRSDRCWNGARDRASRRMELLGFRTAPVRYVGACG